MEEQQNQEEACVVVEDDGEGKDGSTGDQDKHGEHSEECQGDPPRDKVGHTGGPQREDEELELGLFFLDVEGDHHDQRGQCGNHEKEHRVTSFREHDRVGKRRVRHKERVTGGRGRKDVEILSDGSVECPLHGEHDVRRDLWAVVELERVVERDAARVSVQRRVGHQREQVALLRESVGVGHVVKGKHDARLGGVVVVAEERVDRGVVSLDADGSRGRIPFRLEQGRYDPFDRGDVCVVVHKEPALTGRGAGWDRGVGVGCGWGSDRGFEVSLVGRDHLEEPKHGWSPESGVANRTEPNRTEPSVAR